MKNVKSTLGQLGIFKKNSKTQQLLLGVATGYATGYMAMKVGRTAAFLLGTGIIVFQVAQNQGFTKSTWHDAKEKARCLQDRMDSGLLHCWKRNATKYAHKNTCFSASFVGGFFLAVATV